MKHHRRTKPSSNYVKLADMSKVLHYYYLSMGKSTVGGLLSDFKS